MVLIFLSSLHDRGQFLRFLESFLTLYVPRDLTKIYCSQVYKFERTVGICLVIKARERAWPSMFNTYGIKCGALR
jgi:hypothetical protein